MKIELDPYRISIMGRSAITRVAGVILLVACLWMAIAWAVALP